MILQEFVHCALLGGQFMPKALLANYSNTQLLWDTTVTGACYTEMKARICGVDSQTQSFKFYFCISLFEAILRHTDKLRRYSSQICLLLKVMHR